MKRPPNVVNLDRLIAIFTVTGVPEDKIRPISSAVDKLDQLSGDEVKQDMVKPKGLPESVADQIGHVVRHRGHRHRESSVCFKQMQN